MHAQLKYYLSFPYPLKLRFYLLAKSIEKVKLEKGSRDQLECLFYTPENPTNPHTVEVIDKTLLWISQYFSRKTPTITLPLQPFKTEFSSEVLKALSKTEFGTTLTYKELGTVIHRPEAARAVGMALNKNPYPLIIPCHRVVSQSGIGGFAYPIEIKQLLLNFEKGHF